MRLLVATTVEHKPSSRFHCLFINVRNFQSTSSLSYEMLAAIGFDALLCTGRIIQTAICLVVTTFCFIGSASLSLREGLKALLQALICVFALQSLQKCLTAEGEGEKSFNYYFCNIEFRFICYFDMIKS